MQVQSSKHSRSINQFSLSSHDYLIGTKFPIKNLTITHLGREDSEIDD